MKEYLNMHEYVLRSYKIDSTVDTYPGLAYYGINVIVL